MRRKQLIATAALIICGLCSAQSFAGEEATEPTDIIKNIRKLVATMTDENAERMKRSAAAAKLASRRKNLAGLGAPAVSPIIKAVAASDDDTLRVNLLITLWNVKDRSAVGPVQISQLSKLLEDKAYPVSYWALKNISTSSDRRAMKPLLEALKDNNPHRLRLAMRALVDRNATSSVDQIRPLLKDKRMLIRIEAVTALKALGSKDDVEFLVPLLRDPDPIPQRAAIDAIEKLTGTDFGIMPKDDSDAVQQKIDAWIKDNA